MSLSLDILDHFLEQQVSVDKLVVGFSGGLDSVVLLHVLSHSPHYSNKHITAVHINHGISKHAQQWQQWCQQQAQQWKISYAAHSIVLEKHAGESLENVARIERYKMFSRYIDKHSLLLTAHHQDDQAETVLLQLLRGAGVKGLSAMPEVASFAGAWHSRPLLAYTRQALEAYAKQHGLDWIEDESNKDICYDRNYIRHQVLPGLRQRWPAATETIARSAKHCAVAANLILSQATKDWEAVSEHELIDLSALALLSRSRQMEVIRYGLSYLQLPICSHAKMCELLDTMLLARRDSNPIVCWHGVEARRYRHRLYLQPPLPPFDNQQTMLVTVAEAADLPQQQAQLHWQQQLRGLSVHPGQQLLLKYRQGGERLQPIGRQGSHPLKKLMQEWEIPPWLRERVPLLFLENELIAVAGFAIAEAYACQGQQLGWLPILQGQ